MILASAPVQSWEYVYATERGERHHQGGLGLETHMFIFLDPPPPWILDVQM